MKRLITFGDSWTSGHGVETDITYKEVANPDYFIEQLRRSNGWPRFLAEKYSIPFVNMGITGGDNVDILNCINENKRFITNTDLVVVMLSYPYRHLTKGDIPLGNVMSDLLNTLDGLDYYIFNSFFPTFKEEPYLKNELDLSKFLKIDDTALDILVEYEKQNQISVWEYNFRNIFQNDNNATITGDYHPNNLGYRIVADWIFNNLQYDITYNTTII